MPNKQSAFILACMVGLATLCLGPALVSASVSGAAYTSVPTATQVDTTYFARMAPLLVTGYRIDGSYTGEMPEPGRSDQALLLASARPRTETAAVRDTVDVTPNGIAVGGLITDETFSVVGARFSRAFRDRWSEPENVAGFRFTIRLAENPVPRFGAQVLVEIEGTQIFQAYLRPNQRQIRQAAQQAVQRAQFYLKRYYEPREVY